MEEVGEKTSGIRRQGPRTAIGPRAGKKGPTMGQRKDGPPRVLVVDDEAGVRRVLRDVAKRALKAEAWEASDGEEALRIFGEIKPDVVLSDIRMPAMDGITLLRHLKEKDPQVPVILVTGYPSVDVAIQGMKEGASDFLTKPFRLDQVQIVLEKALRERKLLQDNQDLRQELKHKRTIEKLNEKLHKKVKEMSAICSLGQTIAAFPLNRDAILRSLVNEARGAVNAMWVNFLVVEKGNFVSLARSPDEGASGLSGSAPQPSMAILQQASRLRAPILVPRRWKASDPSSPSNVSSNGNLSQMIVPLLIKGEVIGIVHVAGRLDGQEFDRHDLAIVSELAKRAALGLENKYLYESVFEILMSTLSSLVSTIEARDRYTKQHSQRVTEVSLIIARKMECTPEQLDTLKVAGYLHDLGKLGVRDSVLLKPGPLTEEEFAQIKAHPVIGEAIIAPIGFLPEEKSLIRHHHERWDGKGYPDGLKGEEIPFLARILSVADVFDALTSDRPYRPAMSLERSASEIIKGSGSQFDPCVVMAFEEVLPSLAEKVRRNPKPEEKNGKALQGGGNVSGT